MRYSDPTITSIVIHQTLKRWRNSESDTVILGCTHYPLLYKLIYDYFGGKKTVKLLDHYISFVLQVAQNLDRQRHVPLHVDLYV
jgi:glutamate racemase